MMIFVIIDISDYYCGHLGHFHKADIVEKNDIYVDPYYYSFPQTVIIYCT